MPDSSSEPEKYSIDEMIDRLKSQEASQGSGELVTRSDGYQAVRTRKRKRRTNQPFNKEAKRNQRLQIFQIAGIVVVLFFAFLIAGVGILYANSSSYRESLIAKAERITGAEITLNQFRMNPATANAGKITMDWPKNHVLGSLEVDSVVAKIAPLSFLGKKFQGEEIVASQGDLILRNPTNVGGADEKSELEDESSIRFSRYSIPRLNIFFGGEKNRESMLEETEASFFPSLVPRQGEIRLNTGLLKLKNWPSMELDRSYINIRNKELHVQSMRFKIPDNGNRRTIDSGSITFSGVIKSLDTSEVHTLAASLETFRFSELLGKDLGRFFLGSVATKEVLDTNFIRFNPGSGEEALLELTVTHAFDSRIDLTQFKFLEFLSLSLDDRWYEFPNFDSEVSAIVRRYGQKVELDSISFEKRGRMALRGSISTGEAGQISGTLRVGIPESMVSASQNKSVQKMFGPVREGYQWVDLTIGGTSAIPADNFKELYDAARESLEATEGIGSEAEETLDDFIEEFE